MEHGRRSSDITDKDVEEYAKLFGINKQREEQLYKYMKRLVMQPLPINWCAIRNAEGTLEYVNKLTVKRLCEHPCKGQHMVQIQAYKEQLSAKTKVKATVVNEASSAQDICTGTFVKSEDQNAPDSIQDESRAQRDSAASSIKEHNTARHSSTDARESVETSFRPSGDNESVQGDDVAFSKKLERPSTSHRSSSGEQQQAAGRREPIGEHPSDNEPLADRSEQTAERVEERQCTGSGITISHGSCGQVSVADNAEKLYNAEERMSNEPSNLEGVRGFAAQIGIRIPEESDLFKIAEVGYSRLTQLRKQREGGCDMCRRRLRKEEQQLTSSYKTMVETTRDCRFRDAQLWESTVRHAYECDQIQQRILAMMRFSP